MDKDLLLSAREAILQAQRVLLTCHQRPDGDAIGSMLGLGLAIKDAGIDVQMVSVDGVPSSFHHLVGTDQITRKTKGEFDVIVVLDSSDQSRIGDVLEDDSLPTINIDHHITNNNFGNINIVDSKASSTTEILARHMSDLGLNITLPIANALLTGLITDTLGFRTANMTSEVLRIAANLMDYGCDLPGLYQKALLDRSFKAARYWGAGLTTLELDDRLLWAELTLEARKAIGYPGRDDADLINILSSIKDIDIAIIFVEQKDDTVKVSWRSHSGYDVSKIAFQFGGGGHKAAAGAEIQGELAEIKADVIIATRELLNIG